MTQLNKVMTTFILIALVKAESTLTTSESWGYGFLTGFCLSLLGFVAALLLICLQQCLTEGCFKIFVNQLYALACGAIIGDAMIHILPEAFKSQATNSKYVALIFICAILFFIILERIFHALGVAHEHWGQDSNHHSHHSHSENGAGQPEEEQHKKQNYQSQNGQRNEAIKHAEEKMSPNKSNQILTSNFLVSEGKKPSLQEIVESNHNNEKKAEGTSEPQGKKSCLQNLKGKGAAGYLNLLSSFVHNFFDGFGIGVGFASGDMKVIMPIVIAIVAHEIPREMGDVGILIKNGFSNVQTVLCNGFINFMSLIGVIAGLALGGISDEALNYVLVFVAGNFIYIGADIWRHLLANKKMALNILEILMFSIGVGAMFLVLLAEPAEQAAPPPG